MIDATSTSTRATVTVTDTVGAVGEATQISPGRVKTSYLDKPDHAWTWEDLRDYVVTQIRERHGERPRDPQAEIGIFKRFHRDWGAAGSAAIARYAFGPVCKGMWMGAPITAYRFCANSDPTFAMPIALRLEEAAAAAGS